jgi:hypothetical protein
MGFEDCEADPVCDAYADCYYQCPAGLNPKYPESQCVMACGSPPLVTPLAWLADCIGTSGFNRECAAPCQEP